MSKTKSSRQSSHRSVYKKNLILTFFTSFISFNLAFAALHRKMHLSLELYCQSTFYGRLLVYFSFTLKIIQVGILSVSCQYVFTYGTVKLFVFKVILFFIPFSSPTHPSYTRTSTTTTEQLVTCVSQWQPWLVLHWLVVQSSPPDEFLQKSLKSKLWHPKSWPEPSAVQFQPL